MELPSDPIELAQLAVGPHQHVRTEYVREGNASAWERYRPMAELHEHELAAYRELTRRMLAALTSYLETHVIHGAFGKADRFHADTDWVLITPLQLEALRSIIGDHHEAYVAGMLSPGLLTPQELQRLIDAGILPQDLAFVAQPGPQELPPQAQAAVEQAYRYGRALAAEPSRERQGMLRTIPFEEYKKRPPQPLGRTEREAIHWAEEHAAEHVRGLSKRIAADLTSQVVAAATEHARDEHEQEYEIGESPLTREDIKDTVIESIKKRESWRKIVTNLGDKSNDWSRDLGRIAATEKTRALQEGFVRGLAKQQRKDPAKIRVAKMPAPTACKHCVALHLTGGPGSPPHIFPLSELIANGSNVGKKARDWLPTVGPVHPWCQCEIVHVPEGWVFDDAGQMVPELLTRSERFQIDLVKSATAWAEKIASYSDSVPETGVSVRVGDPSIRMVVEEVLSRTPQALFTKLTGVTLITTDSDRESSHLESGDWAYWAGNEIRLHQTLPLKKVRRVLEHEIGHALNVHVFHQLGSVQAVQGWHDALWLISEREGFVSLYAQRSPLENAAEATRWYLYYRSRLMRDFPRQFTFLRKAYKALV